MEIAILIVICLGLIIQRHLNTYWEVGKLPYAHGFLLFFWVFYILCLINFIWLFGVVVGLILALLTFFQIPFSTFLWPFLVPGLIRDNFKSDIEYMVDKKGPSEFIYGGWTILIVALAVLTIMNFFVSSYSFLTEFLLETVNGNYGKVALYALVVIIGGNLLRIVTTTLINKWIDLK